MLMGNEYLWHTYDQQQLETVLHISQLLYNKKTCQEVAHEITFYNVFVFVFCDCKIQVFLVPYFPPETNT